MNNLPKKPNILILLNDQDSAAVTENWPKTFEQQYLPATTRLKKHGLTFNRMFTGSAACSPSRATLLTSTFPKENGVLHTLGTLSSSETMARYTPRDFTQDGLHPTQLNLAHMLKAAGYKVVWKGKWHLSHPVSGTDNWTEKDIQYMEHNYGFHSWNPSDAGYSKIDPQRFASYNDPRFVDGEKDYTPKAESAIDFINNYQPEDGSFCLIVSLVNPHDIHVAPFYGADKGYEEKNIPNYGLPIPQNADEDLSTKPEVQEIWKQHQIALGDPVHNFQPKTPTYIDPKVRQTFVDFYGQLRNLEEVQINSILDALDQKGLTENTLIVRTSDHGEMCLAHGLREKAYNAYEETIRVPLIISNPGLFPEPKQTNALASSIDLLPTLAKITGVYDIFKYAFRGCDLTPLLEKPEENVVRDGDGNERDCIHFTYDDGFLPEKFQDTPLRIRTIRTQEWKYSVYFNDDGTKYEYELYNLQKDPHENNNLAGVSSDLDSHIELHNKLQKVMIEMGTLPSAYRIFPQEIQDQTEKKLVTHLYWPTKEEALVEGAKMQAENNLPLEKQTYKRSDRIQDQVKQIPENMWWIY